MTDLEQLIQSADNFCANLDLAAKNEKKFCDKLLFEFERMGWEAYRMSNDLKQIKEYQGGFS